MGAASLVMAARMVAEDLMVSFTESLAPNFEQMSKLPIRHLFFHRTCLPMNMGRPKERRA